MLHHHLSGSREWSFGAVAEHQLPMSPCVGQSNRLQPARAENLPTRSQRKYTHPQLCGNHLAHCVEAAYLHSQPQRAPRIGGGARGEFEQGTAPVQPDEIVFQALCESDPSELAEWM